MKKKYQNLFFVFGVAVLALMLTQLDYREAWNGLTSTGYWFFAVSPSITQPLAALWAESLTASCRCRLRLAPNARRRRSSFMP